MAKKQGFGFSKGGGSWVSGVGKIKFLKNNNVGVEIDGTKYKFSSELLPEFPKEISEKTEYYVTIILDLDTDEVERVFSVRPSRWADAPMRAVDMTRPESDADPAPYTDKFERLKINVFMEFIEGEFKGCRIPYNVLDKFKSDGEGSVTWSFTEEQLQDSKAKRIKQAFEFYNDIMQVTVEPMDWPEDGNVYPELLARMLNSKRVVKTTGKDGWIIDMYADESYVPKDVEQKDDGSETPFDGEEKEEDDDDGWGE